MNLAIAQRGLQSCLSSSLAGHGHASCFAMLVMNEAFPSLLHGRVVLVCQTAEGDARGRSGDRLDGDNFARIAELSGGIIGTPSEPHERMSACGERGIGYG